MDNSLGHPIFDKNIASPGTWVSQYADYLFRYAMSRLNDEEQARDLVQETFLSGLEKLDNFKGISSEKTWLTAILKNKIIDIYRKKSSRSNQTVSTEETDYDRQDFFDPENGHWNNQHQPSPFAVEHEDLLVSKEFNKILQQCMQKLPSLWFSVFSMKHLDDEATEFICTELKVTPANFWVIIHRTKVNLRSCLQKNWL
ncbi:sigma-70 family RNA polymerase sigma factor [Pedobacter duraquae]|uniref:RNA polymerase sigma-70 factor (ECF subfamily) n=1 Tax=Pedobacter duraquae TaxID=425511 RepID=A0A4R6IN28_9SPHI|nr:sigma-70 family RNA polymerase sigma factor [Pedobacter duraquae]TDO23365.1 RNA polymerase sigma-70 factor (ECF subfamily) [Pedobacter duraquae]